MHASYLIICPRFTLRVAAVTEKNGGQTDGRTHAHTHTHTHTHTQTAITLRCACAQARALKCKTLGGTLSVASSRCACSPANHTHTRVRHGSHVPTHIRACAMDRSRKLFRLFSRHISGTQSFRENRHIHIDLLVVHNPLVPLIGRLVACSARTRADRQTDRQNDYRNPRCACAPRVNEKH